MNQIVLWKWKSNRKQGLSGSKMMSWLGFLEINEVIKQTICIRRSASLSPKGQLNWNGDAPLDSPRAALLTTPNSPALNPPSLPSVTRNKIVCLYVSVCPGVRSSKPPSELRLSQAHLTDLSGFPLGHYLPSYCLWLENTFNKWLAPSIHLYLIIRKLSWSPIKLEPLPPFL